MVEKSKEFLVQIAGEIDGKARSYSGRGMSGKQCVGITTDSERKVFGQIAANVECSSEADTAYNLITSAQVDSMGVDAIIYWPNIPWED